MKIDFDVEDKRKDIEKREDLNHDGKWKIELKCEIEIEVEKWKWKWKWKWK